MAYGELNGHVIDDVMSTRKVKLVTPMDQYAHRVQSQNQLEIKRLRYRGPHPPIGNGLWGNKWSPDRWRHV